MMLPKKLLYLTGPLLISLAVALALASYATSNIYRLSFPIPRSLGIFTIFLPVVQGAFMLVLHRLFRHASQNGLESITIRVLAIVMFLSIYETIVATLAASNAAPSSAVDCGLTQRWQEMFSSKDERAIRTIQDRFNCCGLRSLRDRAWPFPSDARSSCPETFLRTQSCLVPWRREQNMNSILILVAAIDAVVVMIAFLTILLRRAFSERRLISLKHVPRINGLDGYERLLGDSPLNGDNRDGPSNEGGLTLEGHEENGTNESEQLIENGDVWRIEGNITR